MSSWYRLVLSCFQFFSLSLVAGFSLCSYHKDVLKSLWLEIVLSFWSWNRICIHPVVPHLAVPPYYLKDPSYNMNLGSLFLNYFIPNLGQDILLFLFSIDSVVPSYSVNYLYEPSVPPNFQMLKWILLCYLICLVNLCPIIFILVMKCDAQAYEGSQGENHLGINDYFL